MSNDKLAPVLEQSQALLAPVVKTNKLAVAQLERLVAFQKNALPSYVDLGLERLKAAATVDSPQSLQDFLTGQVEAVTTLRQKLIDDAKALTELSAGFQAEISELAKENASELSNQAAKLADTVANQVKGGVAKAA